MEVPLLDPFLLDWVSLALRWLHVVAGVGWIGTSLYFAALNNRLRPVRGGAGSELWAVHGGAFYRVEKVDGTPGQLPDTLHWFKWEAYLTWLSGASLLVVAYYLGSAALLVDPSGPAVSHGAATAIGVGTLAVGWGVYDSLCKSPLRRSPRAFAAVGFALATATAWGLTQVLSPRAAYIHVGAMLGTLMAGNVFRVIIPNQKRMVAALAAGRAPDSEKGRAAGARSMDNNYLTLPVILIMVSVHYPMTYGHPWNWAVLAALSGIGASINHLLNFNARGRRTGWFAPVAALGIAVVALLWLVRPPPVEQASEVDHVDFAQVRGIIERRCVGCHATRPSNQQFAAPPLGVVLESSEQIQAFAPRIRSVAITSHTMPLGNLTAMSDEERAQLGRWIDQGARITP